MKRIKLVVSAMAALVAAFAAVAEDVTIDVPDGETRDFYSALSASGYEKSALTGQRIVKTGLGTLIGTNDLTTKSATTPYFHKLLVSQGTFRASRNGDFGYQGFQPDAVTVEPGGTICLVGSGINIDNRVVRIAGSGASGEGGAIVCAGYGQSRYGQFELTDDATFMTTFAGDYALVLMLEKDRPNPTSVTLNGHDLTLKAAGKGSRYGYRIDRGMRLKGSGRFIVDGTYLGQGAASVSNYTAAANNGYVTLVLKNGATFRPRQQSTVSFFDAIDAEYGTTIAAGENDSAAFDMYVSAIAGAPAATALSSLNVSDSLTVRVSDIAAGHFISVDGTLVFGASAQLSVDGDIGELAPDASGRVKIASSEMGITGLPQLVTAAALRNWSVETGDEGLSLYLRYHSSKPEGAIDVFADWGVLRGEGNAAGNAARFNNALSSLAAENPVLYFPAGNYWFDEPLVIAKSGVTVLGDACTSVLKAATGFAGTSLLSISGSGATVCGVTLSGTTGPAIYASGTTSLAVTNNDFTAVGGAIDGGDDTYPIEVVGGTGTFVRDNLILDGATYTAPVFINGGSKAEGGEPISGQVRIRVDAGESISLTAAFARTGYATYPSGSRLVKTGPGTLLVDNTETMVQSSTSATVPVLGITVEEGVYSVSGNYFGRIDFGSNDPTIIKSGGTVLLTGSSTHFNNRMIQLEGAGAPGMGGAIAMSGVGICNYAQFRLTGDAVIATSYADGYARCFNRLSDTTPATVRFNGHTLTLKSINGGKGFSMESIFKFGDVGTLCLDGTTLAQHTAIVAPYNSKLATLALRNGAKFLPRSQDIVELFGEIDCDATSQVVGGDGGAAAFAMTVGAWAGSGAVGSGFSSLSITNSITVLAADLVAGRHMTAACPLVFADGVKMALSDAGLLNEAVPFYTCAVSDVSVDGCPICAQGCDFRQFRPVQGEDGKSIALVRTGLIMIVL